MGCSLSLGKAAQISHALHWDMKNILISSHPISSRHLISYLIPSHLGGLFFTVARLRCRKKHATFFSQEWKHAPNYVAKSYMEKVDGQVYFEDVKLQMDAKLWGEEFNRHNPPKKVGKRYRCSLRLQMYFEGGYSKMLPSEKR